MDFGEGPNEFVAVGFLLEPRMVAGDHPKVPYQLAAWCWNSFSGAASKEVALASVRSSTLHNEIGSHYQLGSSDY